MLQIASAVIKVSKKKIQKRKKHRTVIKAIYDKQHAVWAKNRLRVIFE